MTKKAIQEKYDKALQIVTKDIELYKNDVIMDINKYNKTSYDIYSLSPRELRKAVIQTLEIIEDEKEKRSLMLTYEGYQKLRREHSLIVEFLGDIQ